MISGELPHLHHLNKYSVWVAAQHSYFIYEYLSPSSGQNGEKTLWLKIWVGSTQLVQLGKLIFRDDLKGQFNVFILHKSEICCQLWRKEMLKYEGNMFIIFRYIFLFLLYYL